MRISHEAEKSMEAVHPSHVGNGHPFYAPSTLNGVADINKTLLGGL